MGLGVWAWSGRMALCSQMQLMGFHQAPGLRVVWVHGLHRQLQPPWTWRSGVFMKDLRDDFFVGGCVGVLWVYGLLREMQPK